MPDGLTPIIHHQLDRLKPLDYRTIAAAGDPGTPARIAVFAALNLLDQCRVWRHGGRDPASGLDWLGFVRAVAIEVWRAETLAPDSEPAPHADLDLDEHTSDTALAELITSWPGLVMRPNPCCAQPGDIVLHRSEFTGLIGNGAVLIGANQIAHAYRPRAPVRSRRAPYWRERERYAFTWRFP